MLTECFFNLFLEISHINKLEELELKLEKLLGFRNMQEKLEKIDLKFGHNFSIPTIVIGDIYLFFAAGQL